MATDSILLHFLKELCNFLLNYIFHFILDERLKNTSFFYLFQNSLQICCTFLHSFLEYLSGDAKIGGGIKIFNFLVKCVGLSGIRLVMSLIVSLVNGQELTIASTSTSRVCNDSSVRVPPLVFNKELRITLALWSCCSQIPPMLLVNGEFLYSQISYLFSNMFFQIFTDLWMIHFLNYAWINSAEAPIKFNPLLYHSKWTFLLWQMNFIKYMAKESFCFTFFSMIFYHKRPKHINITKCKGSFFTHHVSW